MHVQTKTTITRVTRAYREYIVYTHSDLHGHLKVYRGCSCFCVLNAYCGLVMCVCSRVQVSYRRGGRIVLTLIPHVNPDAYTHNHQCHGQT